jgi:signal transduction histidine kinase
MLKDFCLISLRSKPINSVAGSTGMRIAYLRQPAMEDLARRYLPPLTPVLSDTADEVFQSLCAGSADGAFLDLKVTQSMLLRRPSGCETTQLRSIEVPEASQPQSIGSNQKTAAVADELRSEIGRMSSDGSLEAIYAKWQLPTPYDARTFDSLAKARRLRYIRLCGIAGLIVVLVILGFLIYRLRRTNRLARSSMTIHRRFVTNISKEFRTPLNGVVGMTDLLLSSELAADHRSYAETVQGCARSLLDMLNNLQDYSRLEEGAIVLDNRDFEVHGVVEEVMEHYAAQARAQGLEISCVIAPNVPQIVTGDPVRLRQVLGNLVSNAVKFTITGEVSISARLVSGTDRTVVLHFEVTDTGEGINPANRAKLFECFSGGDAELQAQRGTGLGLAICRKIVDAAGGQIDFTSEPGKGSTFWVLMQFGQTQENLPPKDSASLEGTRALLIPGSRSIRRSVHNQLTYLGVYVESSDTPKAGAVILAAENEGRAFKVVILDDVAADALEFARELASVPCVNPPRLVLLSGLQSRDWPKRSSESGIAAILSKPVRQSHLEQTLDTIFQKPTQGIPAPIAELTGPRHDLADDFVERDMRC